MKEATPPLRVLVAGLGSIGQRHVRNLRALADVDIIAYRSRTRPLPPEVTTGAYRETFDFDEALASAPDAALICNPPAEHVHYSLRAAEAGCHLFIEKPLANSMTGVSELIRTVAGRGLVGHVGFNLRFHPGLRLVKRLLDRGVIGTPVSIRAEVGQYLPDWHPGEDHRKGYSARTSLGGGVVLDLIHELDYVMWLMGPVVTVTAHTAHHAALEIETEAVAEIGLGFENGALGSVHMDYVRRDARRTCHVIGDEGTLIWDYESSSVRLFDSRSRRWFGRRHQSFERNDMFVAELRHFLTCVRTGAQPVTDLEWGAAVLQVALDAKRRAGEHVEQTESSDA